MVIIHTKQLYYLELSLLKYLKWPTVFWDIMELIELICYSKAKLLERVKTKHSKTYTKMLPMSTKE